LPLDEGGKTRAKEKNQAQYTKKSAKNPDKKR
jgi:hypothetical protein